MALANGQQDMAEVIGAFGKCFRISLSYGREQISMGQEVEHVSAYVKVQQFRFRNSFEWICEVEEDICGFMYPTNHPAARRKCYLPRLKRAHRPWLYHVIRHKGRRYVAFDGQ